MIPDSKESESEPLVLTQRKQLNQLAKDVAEASNKESYIVWQRIHAVAGVNSITKGQRTHVLRHTFASHFMMRGGNILVLQQILGHSTIMMAMRYAHFAHAHLDAAITLNPFDCLKAGESEIEKN